MKVGLFIPCYIDQFYPNVGIATLRLLERLGCEVEYPAGQTCCGQPLANAGHAPQTHGIMAHFADLFDEYEYIVAPSGSCVLHLNEHLKHPVAARIHELCAFLTDILQVQQLEAVFHHKVGLHASCHGLRGLRLGRSSEVQDPPFDKVRALLDMVDGVEVVDLDRKDECCGFGGTFAVTEEAISAKMGQDRLRDHLNKGAEVVTGTDMSCLMHLDGLIRRQDLPLRVMHIAEILNGGQHA